MEKKLAALGVLVAVSALHTIRLNGDRHVPGTKSQTFETDRDTADHLVTSGAAVYAAAEQAAAPDGSGDANTGESADAGSGEGAAAAATTAPAKTAPAKTPAKKR